MVLSKGTYLLICTMQFCWANNLDRMEDRINSINNFGLDKDKRTIYLYGDITRERGWQFLINLDILNESDGDIIVKLFSTGGDYAAGFAMFDAIKASKNKVVVEGTGEIFSMAVIILQAGYVRLLTPSSRLMIHNVFVSVTDEKLTSHYIARYGKEMSELSLRYQQVLTQRTGLSTRKIRAWCEQEKYLDAKMAVQIGFADKIIGVMKHENAGKEDIDRVAS